MSDATSIPNPYAAVLADLVRRRDELNIAIKAIEAVGGVGASSTASAPSSTGTTNDSPVPDEPGQYLGLSISEAAKKLLGARKKNMTSAEIAKALIDGGMPIKSVDPGNTVGSILTRRFNSVGDIVRVSRSQWGLRGWYPHAVFKKKSESPKEAGGATKPEEADLQDGPELEPGGIF